MRTLVVGGGIAGLAAAIAFRRAGLEVEIVEAQPDWSPLSSGMFLQSNGLGMLNRLGILEPVLNAGFGIPDDLMPVSTFDGWPITDVRYPRLAGPDVPAILGIKRVALHAILTEAIDRLGIPVRFGTVVETLVGGSDGSSTQVTTTDGRAESFEFVVAADGIRSSLRATCFPDRADPRYSGFGAWRCVCPRPSDLKHKLMMIGPGARLGVMPISNDELYMFGITPEPVEARYEPTAWATLMRERFADFRGRAPELFAVATLFHYTAVEEVPAAQPLHREGVVLIGDAAHATTPFMGQGGSMALEDAVVLAEVVSRGTSLVRALEEYERRRFPRIEFVQARSFDAGRAWGGDRSAYSPETLKTTMQARVDGFYAQLTPAP